MVDCGLYYAKPEFGKMIRELGGVWNDEKHRPFVCLIQANKHKGIYWAIPMGKYNHRNEKQIERLNYYLNLPKDDIRSCYYHVGRTTAKSIFFVSDAVPISDKYIESPHLGSNCEPYVIKNKALIKELERKLFRIISKENSNNNCFRQHITDIMENLEHEMVSLV